MAYGKNHPKVSIPADPEGRARYESAMKHVEWAKANGKSTDEIHEIFKKVMESTEKHSKKE